MTISRERRSIVKPAYPSALIALALCLALAGCGATDFVSDPALMPSPQPTPLPAGTFTTYTNTTYGYSISYPQNWVFEDADPTAMSFMVFNYNPQTYQQPFSAPPLLKIEIDAAPNPSHLSPLDYFKNQISLYGLKGTIQSSQAITLAKHNAEQVIWRDTTSQYSTIFYLIAKGDTMLNITQSNAANGQPSPVFTQMLASLTITG